MTPGPFLLTWVGHATVLFECANGRLVTDPALTRQLAHLRRRRPLAELPPVDGVLLSHLHMDHFHLPSLKRVAHHGTAVVPLGGESLLATRPFHDIRTVVPGDHVELAGFDIEVVHADHLHGRGPHSKLTAHPVGYVVRHQGRAVYFGGDTDLFDAMADLGPIDVALIPIWGWGPTLGERHLDPTTAAQAVELIDPRVVIPIHWGTYSPMRHRRGDPPWLERPLGAFRGELAARGLEGRMVALEPGGSFPVPATT
jgi:L-ascorbate metabolism protein UlaG (beta-lactamase superfamily)